MRWFVIGDLIGDRQLDYNDLTLWQKKFSDYNGLTFPFDKNDYTSYICDVDRNGEINVTDYAVLEDLVKNGGDMYRFYWNDITLEAFNFEYYKTLIPPVVPPTGTTTTSTVTTTKPISTTTNITTTKPITTTTNITTTTTVSKTDYNVLSVKDVSITPTADDILNKTVTVAVPLYTLTEKEIYGFSTIMKISDKSAAISFEETYFDLVDDLTGINKIADGEYSITVVFAEPFATFEMAHDPSALNLLFELSATAGSVEVEFTNTEFVLSDKDVLIDKPVADTSMIINITEPITTYGDFNGDDSLSMADLVMLYQHLNGKREFNQYQRMAADIVKDNSINVLDLAYFRREMLKSKGIYD
jgi:hypothetical protein